jgi:Flp pilus assembly pilin Flp
MVTTWWIRVNHRLRDLLRREELEGQGLVEYALIISFVALVCFFAVKFLQPNISATLNNVSNAL